MLQECVFGVQKSGNKDIEVYIDGGIKRVFILIIKYTHFYSLLKILIFIIYEGN